MDCGEFLEFVATFSMICFHPSEVLCLSVRYNATVTGVTTGGCFIVTFDAYGNQEEIQLEDLRQLETEGDSRIVYKGTYCFSFG